MHPARSTKIGIACVAVAMAAAAVPTVASAQSDNNQCNGIGGIISCIIIQAMRESALKSWQAVDPDVRTCLAQNYGFNFDGLIQNGISAKDSSISGQLQSCQQAVAQARHDQQQRLIEIQQAITAAQNAWGALDPRVRQCASARGLNADQLAQKGIGPYDKSLNGAVQSCRDQIDQDDNRRHEEAARHNYLVAQFGSDEAADIEAGRVTVGMSKKAVLEARGRGPDHKDVIPPDDEMWVYGTERISISKGKVTYVGH